MRSLFVITLSLLSLWSSADHLLGSEITYTHIVDKQYKINITLYRNCNECKLGNDGGGTQTDKCSDLDRVFIRTVNSACSDSRVGTITLSKVGNYKNITEICNLDNSACGDNPTYPYGIEAHYYEGTVDFEDYSAYTGCEFHLYINKTHRSNSINTLQTNNDRQYNYATINPWLVDHSSPVIVSHPRFIYPLNQPVYEGVQIEKEEGDSLVFRLDRPYRGHNDLIPYSAGFSASQFISAYCPAGNCTPDANATPPRGISFDTQNGNLIFTPSQASQQAIKVLVVEQWRRINNSWVKIGAIRRDIQQDISNPQENHTPKLLTQNLNYCIAQTVEDTIYVWDAPFTNSSTQDSVHITLNHNILGLSAEVISVNNAPYKAVRIHGTPADGQEGQFLLYYHIEDNFCPVYGKANGSVTIKIEAKPNVSISSTPLFCGTHELKIDADNKLVHRISARSLETSLFTDSIITDGFTFQKIESGDISAEVVSSSLACTDTTVLIISNEGATSVEKAQLTNSERNICQDDSLSLDITHTSYGIQSVQWIYNTEIVDGSPFITTGSSDSLLVSYELLHEGISCPMKDTMRLVILEKPSVSFTAPTPRCFTNEISVAEYLVSPSGGTWEVNDNPITNTVPLSTIVPNTDAHIDISYIYTADNGCTTRVTRRQDILPSPILTLQNQSVCGTNNNFRLKNAIALPFSPILDDISWDIINASDTLVKTINNNLELDIQNAGKGEYIIAAINETTNGCIAKDTFTISVTDGIILEVDSSALLCQGDEEINLSDAYSVNVTGGGWSSNYSLNHTSLNGFIPRECGPIELHYVYDRNGCFDEIRFTSNIICKPIFNLLPDSLCANSEPIDLPSPYDWNGQSISNNTFDPKDLTPNNYEHSASVVVDGCTFDTTVTYTILPSLDFSWSNLPDRLCEGNILSIKFDKPTYTNLTIENCNNTASTITDSLFSYLPAKCDLDVQMIKLKATLDTKYSCPITAKEIAISYYAKPEPLVIKAVDGCEPYHLDISLDTDNRTQYTLTGNTEKITGNTNHIDVKNLAAGNYSLDILQTSMEGCETAQSLPKAIRINATPEASFTMYAEDVVTLSDRDIPLNNFSSVSSGALNYEWTYSKDGKQTLFSTLNNPQLELPSDTGTFRIKLLAHTPSGCMDSATNNIRVVPNIIAFIPSAFTPDNKGPESNSKFRVISAHAAQFDMEIYNKWGQRVFSSTNIDESWDGTYLGQFCQNGVYLYNVKIINKAGEKFTFHGTVNLIR